MTTSTRLHIVNLKGGTILSVHDGHPNSAPYLLVQVGKQKYHVEVWRDPEGNGPGYLYIERLVRLVSKKVKE